MPPPASIIIPCLNEAHHLPGVLDALAAQTCPPLEIIVVDGGSSDGAPEAAQRWAGAHPALPVRVLHNPERHIPHALNLGIAAAQGEIILRLDGHSRPASEYVERCLTTLAVTGAAMVGGAWTIRPGATGEVAEAIALAVSSRLGAGDAHYRLPGAQAQWVDTVPFGCFRRSLWQSLGGYNEALLTNEDYEFAARIRQAGGRIWFDPHIRCEYFARATLGALAQQYWRYGWWKAQMLKRFPESLRWRQAVPIAWSLVGVLGLGAAVVWLFARWVAGGLWGLYLVVVLTASLRLAGWPRWRLWLSLLLSFITVHFAWGLGVWAGWFFGRPGPIDEVGLVERA